MAIPTGCLELAESSVDSKKDIHNYSNFYGADGATAAVWIVVETAEIEMKERQKYDLIFLCLCTLSSGLCAPI